MTDLNGHRLELVDCPEDAQFFLTGEKDGEQYLSYDKSSESMGNWRYIKLPPGDYELIGRGDLITEEQWEKLGFGNNNAEPPFQPFYVPYGMSDEEFLSEKRLAEMQLEDWELNRKQEIIELGLSWIRSQGKEPSKTILLLIK